MTSIKQITFIIIISLLFPHKLFAETFTINSCSATTDLFTHISEQVDNRINGVIANDVSKNLFTTRGNLTSPWVWSSTAWTNNISPVDFTGMSPWNSRGGYTRAGTLITPRHIALSEHYTLNVGNVVLFVASDNSIVTRTVSAVQRIGSTDISIAKLDSDVPSTITHYPILDNQTFEKYLNDGFDMNINNLPMVVLDQEDKVLIKDTRKNSFITSTDVSHVQSQNSNRLSFNETLIGGDSGNPSFVLIGNKPALVFTHYGSDIGPSYPYYRQGIQNAINNMGGEHQLSTIDLSCFNSPIVLENNKTLNVFENATTSSLVGNIDIKYNIENNTPYFTILSGNNNGALDVSSSTGQITIASSSLITGANFPRSVEVAVEENGPGGRMSKSTYNINLNSYPYFNANNYYFNVTEHSNINTLIGYVSAYYFQNNALVYSIVSGNESNIFSINSSTGAITVASSSLLNYETNTLHNLTVRVQETSSVNQLYKDVNVNILVNDINYTFSSPSYTFQIDELAENNTSVGFVSSTISDPMNISSVYYEIIAGNTESIFTISSSTGQITINNNNYLNGNNIYNLSIGVKDGSGGIVANSVPVTINVSKNSRPTLSFEQQARSLVVYNVEEGSSVNMAFQLSAPYTKTIIAKLVKTLGSAILNTDYILSTDTLTFLPNETSKIVSFNALTDPLIENTESILLNIVDDIRVSFGPRQNATININNKNIIASSGGGGGFSTPVVLATSTNKNLNQGILVNNKVTGVNNPLFTRSLKLNSVNEDVKRLQQFLNSQGFIVSLTGPGSRGFETTKFGPATRRALARFQSNNNIKPSTGQLGPITLNFINNILNHK